MLGGLDYHSIAVAVKRALSNLGVILGGIESNAYVTFSGVVTPSQITATQNDYAPASLALASALRLSSDAARSITGLTAQPEGRILLLHNVGSFGITLKRQDAGSNASNRFGLDADVVLAPDQSAWLRYDSATARWRIGQYSDGQFRSVQIFTASGTYTAPAGLKRALVELVGGGAGSGGCAATAGGQAAGAGGGSSGGGSRRLLTAAQIGASQTVTIGAAGTAGTAGNNAGGTGGTTSFGALLSATGGTGGSGGVNTAVSFASSGGVPGVGSGGDVNITGQGGGFGIGFATSTLGAGGFGGTSMLGGGAASVATVNSTSGTASGNYGGGASGSALGQSQAAVAGSLGAPGVVIVWEYF